MTLEAFGAARKLSDTHSRPMIVVLDSLDIVFAEIAAGLHFDKFEIDLAGIFQTVRGAARHVADSFSCSICTLSPIVTRAVPSTTTQCSAR